MKHTLRYFILFSIIAIFLSCAEDKSKINVAAIKKNNLPADSLLKDSLFPKVTVGEGDIPINAFLNKQLKSIRENFKRINSITVWTSITKKDLQETTEGGEAAFYQTNNQLEKIATKNFGETFQQVTGYYLLDNQLSFVFEKSYKYNRPMYYDSAAMKENNDTEAFDFDKSKIIETRSYFENGKLIHQVKSQDGGVPLTQEFSEQEQKSILTAFNNLIKLYRPK